MLSSAGRAERCQRSGRRFEPCSPRQTSEIMKLYIAVLDEVPDHMVPVLVAHAVLGAHLNFAETYSHSVWGLKYNEWLCNSFRKVVVRVNRKEFEKIKALEGTFLAHENTTLNGEKSCAVVLPGTEANVLKFAKMWEPV